MYTCALTVHINDEDDLDGLVFWGLSEVFSFSVIFYCNCPKDNRWQGHLNENQSISPMSFVNMVFWQKVFGQNEQRAIAERGSAMHGLP